MPYVGQKPADIISTAVDTVTGKFSGEIDAASLDISGNIDVDGTSNLDIVDIDGAVDMATTLQVDGVATFTARDIHSGGITIANAGQIGSVGDPDAIAIASDGVVTLTQKLIGTELDISGNIDVDGTTNLDIVDIDGAVDMASTLAVAGVVTANAGVVVDEMTLDGDTLTATDTFTIDAVDDITLDAASTLVRIKHNGTQRFIFNTDATPEIDALGGNFTLHANTSDADIIFTGNDGGAAITALTLDMSAGGLAIFNAGLAIGGTGAANTLDDYEKGTWTPTVTGSSSGSYALDSGHKSTYIKVGNICHVSTSIGLGSLTGTASGFAVIGGFPFNYNGGVSQSTGAVIFSQANLASTHEQTHIMQSSSGTANTFFLPFMRDNDSTGETDLSIFSSSTAITFSFSYQTV